RNDTVGGGCRTLEMVPGVHYDVCSAVHPLAAASPYFSSLPLGEHGLRWLHPEVLAAHPVDDHRTALLFADLERTAEGLGADADRWRRTFGPVVDRWTDLTDAILGPLARLPHHPFTLARFGLRALVPSTRAVRRFETDEARALFAGVAAHTMLPLDRPFTSAVALVLTGAADIGGWPVPAGGSQAIADALVAALRSLGGEVVTGVDVTHLDELETAGPVLFDTAPEQLARIAGHDLPTGYRRRLRAYRRGMSVFKVDFVLGGPVPWRDERIAAAGTVHLGGSADEVAAAELAVWRGQVPERPFTLVAQPSVVDPSRAPAGKKVVWAYCHAPPGFTGDLTEVIERHIEFHAPGFRDLIEHRVSRGAVELEADNPNLVGGDIGGGSPAGRQLLLRPTVRVDPYRTPNPRLFLCSSSTPPGAGVHGMCGYWAAESALRRWPD
ncbi:MAG: NAD(P)/FAD-dependent oxidoreductase, partial [Acidimicrobiia bacterium]|nr:NAD(P)/FAD-dependent oxidoreductase [Acidimicrobiia bacterium]